MRKIILFLCCFLLLACSNENEIKINNISFKVPKNIKVLKGNAIDSEIFYLQKHSKRVATCYYGINYSSFSENKIIVPLEIYKVLNDKKNAFVIRDSINDYKNGIFNNNYYYYDTINKNIAQIMLPKKPDKGLIGIYFDSVDLHKNKFAIISNDLSEENKKIFLEIFKTIKITKAAH
jgi:hypothetical protein